MSSSLLVAILILPTQVAPELGGGTHPGELFVALADNTACASCHADQADPTLPHSTYRGSMMDLAGVDPVFMASLEIAYNDFQPASQLCIRCHFPKAWMDGRGQLGPEQDFGLFTNDKQGIQCDFCHRMDIPPPADPNSVVPPPELSGILIANSQIYVANSTTKRGPLEIVNSGFHGTEYSPLFEDSILCAQCHDVSNTFRSMLDQDGTELGIPVPIERTYSEWRDSDFSDKNSPDYRTCMDCHMDTYDGKAATPGPDREGLHSHRIVGANAMAPQMVSYLYNDGVEIPFLQNIAPQVALIVEKVSEQLSRAATMEVVSAVTAGTAPTLRVRITNDTGHKLPTGYAEGRRMFITHDVTRADLTQGPRTGTIDPDTWEYAIGEEPVRAWEILVAEGLEQQSSFHFVNVDRLLLDNRIPPKGFAPKVDTAVVGANYPITPEGGLQHWDEVDLPLGVDDCWPAIVDITLEFQASSGAYLDFLIANSPTYGPDLGEALAAVGADPVQMESLKVAVFEDGRIEDYAGPYNCAPVDPPEVDAGDAPPPPVVDAGDEPDPFGNYVPPPAQAGEEEPGGCACAPTATSSSAADLALLLGVLGLLRRRRSRSAR